MKRLIDFEGKSRTIVQMARDFGINYMTFLTRLRENGYKFEPWMVTKKDLRTLNHNKGERMRLKIDMAKANQDFKTDVHESVNLLKAITLVHSSILRDISKVRVDIKLSTELLQHEITLIHEEMDNLKSELEKVNKYIRDEVHENFQCLDRRIHVLEKKSKSWWPFGK